MQSSFRKFKKGPLVASVALLTLSSSIFFFLYSGIQKNNKNAVELESQWKAEALHREELRAVNRLLGEIGPERTELDAHFIKSSDVVPFLNLVEKLGPQSGSDAEVVLVDLPKDQSGLVVGIEASGRFEAIYKFLMLLENSPYELEIITLDIDRIESADSKNPNPRWLAVFRVKVLSFTP